MPRTHHEQPKLHRLYVALYNLGTIYHWAFVVRNSQSSFLLDATVGDGKRKYRIRNWENDLSKESMTVLCDVMDLVDDSGVEYLLGIAESVPMPPEGDESFCQTWVESVLQTAGENGCVLRASIAALAIITLGDETQYFLGETEEMRRLTLALAQSELARAV